MPHCHTIDSSYYSFTSKALFTRQHGTRVLRKSRYEKIAICVHMVAHSSNLDPVPPKREQSPLFARIMQQTSMQQTPIRSPWVCSQYLLCVHSTYSSFYLCMYENMLALSQKTTTRPPPPTFGSPIFFWFSRRFRTFGAKVFFFLFF